MQTQSQARKGNRSAYFERIAEDLRKRLVDVDVLVIHLQRQADYFGTDPLPRDLALRLAEAKRKAKEYRRDMERALFNAGRR